MFRKKGKFNFIRKETLAQVFSCEFSEIFKNTFFTEHFSWLLLYLAATDLKKAFDFLNYDFLVTALEHCTIDSSFIKWIKILLRNQESFEIIGCHATKYFRLKIGARQEDPISAYLLFSP